MLINLVGFLHELNFLANLGFMVTLVLMVAPIFFLLVVEDPMNIRIMRDVRVNAEGPLHYCDMRVVVLGIGAPALLLATHSVFLLPISLLCSPKPLRSFLNIAEGLSKQTPFESRPFKPVPRVKQLFSSLLSVTTDPSLQMVKEEDVNGNGNRNNGNVGDVGTSTTREAVLTAPMKLEGESDADDYRAPNLLQRVLSLLKNVRPGTDLTRFQMPPIFNIPKSMLQCYGESVYCISKKEMLSECANGKSTLERFTSVVAWSISTTRPLMFGVAPFNPILGETHHVSRGTLNLLLEQVSHHPPVSALHATDEKDGIEMIWCHHLLPKFNGTSVETAVHGQRQLKLLNKGENYVIGHPSLVIRFLPVPGVHWLGNVKIHCQETGLEAELCFGGDSFLGLKANNRSIKGKIFMSSSMKNIYEISGNWDRTVTVKDVSNGEITVIYDAKEALSGLKTPILKNQEGLRPSESTVVWGELSQNILSKCWDRAREAKTVVEETERELVRERKSKGETWVPKHFTVSHSKESGWDCSPNQKLVPPAPIVVPL